MSVSFKNRVVSRSQSTCDSEDGAYPQGGSPYFGSPHALVPRSEGRLTGLLRRQQESVDQQALEVDHHLPWHPEPVGQQLEGAPLASIIPPGDRAHAPHHFPPYTAASWGKVISTRISEGERARSACHDPTETIRWYIHAEAHVCNPDADSSARCECKLRKKGVLVFQLW